MTPRSATPAEKELRERIADGSALPIRLLEKVARDRGIVVKP